tara:strand:- start:2599 stop:2751 length:153 start_codon:yes stop_codon:yes gene_type:complete
MKRLAIIFISLLFLNSCETIGSIKKPDLSKPFSKCPPKEERTVKDILCRE